jgi:integrase
MGRKATTGNYMSHPVLRYRDVVRIVQGRRTDNRELWEGLYFIDGKWSQPGSLKTTDQVEAVTNAAEEYVRQSAGIIPKRPNRRTVKIVAEQALTKLKAEAKLANETLGKSKAHKFLQRINLIERIIIPELGDKTVIEVNDKDFLSRWQKTLTVTGPGGNGPERKPSKSTIGNLNGAFQHVMQLAHDLEWIKEDDIGGLNQGKHEKGERRPPFSRDEMAKIKNWMSDEWIAAGHTDLKREQRYMLRAMIAVLATTGITPGSEIETLTWDQIDFDARDGARKKCIKIHIRPQQGKRKNARDAYVEQRDVWAAGDLLTAYKKWHTPSGYPCIFQRPSDGNYGIYEVTFRSLLEEMGMRIDKETGLPRTLYSLRHYYATQQLLRHTNPSVLTAMMGTSLQMLDNHYGQVIRELQSHVVTGGADPVGRLKGHIEQQMPDPHFDPETGAEDPEEGIRFEQDIALRDHPAESAEIEEY